MKLIVQEKSHNSTLNTEQDTCLYSASKEPSRSMTSIGRDLYEHPRKGLPSLYYLHHWSLIPGRKESISLISPVMAGRFLEERGILCHGLGDQRAAEILRSWGYGMLEEF